MDFNSIKEDLKEAEYFDDDDDYYEGEEEEDGDYDYDDYDDDYDDDDYDDDYDDYDAVVVATKKNTNTKQTNKQIKEESKSELPSFTMEEYEEYLKNPNADKYRELKIADEKKKKQIDDDSKSRATLKANNPKNAEKELWIAPVGVSLEDERVRIVKESDTLNSAATTDGFEIIPSKTAKKIEIHYESFLTSKLNDDVILHIMSFMDPLSLVRLRSLHSRFRHLSNFNSLYETSAQQQISDYIRITSESLDRDPQNLSPQSALQRFERNQEYRSFTVPARELLSSTAGAPFFPSAIPNLVKTRWSVKKYDLVPPPPIVARNNYHYTRNKITNSDKILPSINSKEFPNMIRQILSFDGILIAGSNELTLFDLAEPEVESRALPITIWKSLKSNEIITFMTLDEREDQSLLVVTTNYALVLFFDLIKLLDPDVEYGLIRKVFLGSIPVNYQGLDTAIAEINAKRTSLSEDPSREIDLSKGPAIHNKVTGLTLYKATNLILITTVRCLYIFQDRGLSVSLAIRLSEIIGKSRYCADYVGPSNIVVTQSGDLHFTHGGISFYKDRKQTAYAKGRGIVLSIKLNDVYHKAQSTCIADTENLCSFPLGLLPLDEVNASLVWRHKTIAIFDSRISRCIGQKHFQPLGFYGYNTTPKSPYHYRYPFFSIQGPSRGLTTDIRSIHSNIADVVPPHAFDYTTHLAGRGSAHSIYFTGNTLVGVWGSGIGRSHVSGVDGSSSTFIIPEIDDEEEKAVRVGEGTTFGNVFEQAARAKAIKEWDRKPLDNVLLYERPTCVVADSRFTSSRLYVGGTFGSIVPIELTYSANTFNRRRYYNY